MRAWSLIALVLTACGDVEDGTATIRSAVWGDRVISREESWDFDRLVLRSGATLRARGVYLRVRATELVIEGPVQIDARGHVGAPLDDPLWISSGGALDLCEIAHRDWEQAVRDQSAVSADTRNAGRRGRDSVGVTLIAQRVIGQVGDLHVDVRGGEGGRGRVLACGCSDHPNERYEAAAGPTGASGRWIFVLE